MPYFLAFYCDNIVKEYCGRYKLGCSTLRTLSPCFLEGRIHHNLVLFVVVNGTVIANLDITLKLRTCPCNVYPLEPHFYIAKLGFAGVYLFFLFLLQNIDCGYSLELPHRGSSNVYPQSMFLSKNRKNIFFFSNEIFNFFS